MEQRLQEILGRKAEIRGLLEGNDKIELEALEEELKSLTEEQEALEKRSKMAKIILENKADDVEVRAKPVEEKTKDCGYESEEYRKIFMEYVCRGKSIPKEFRANANTLTTDVGAIVPPVVLNKIIEKVEAYRMILPLVNR